MLSQDTKRQPTATIYTNEEFPVLALEIDAATESMSLVVLNANLSSTAYLPQEKERKMKRNSAYKRRTRDESSNT